MKARRKFVSLRVICFRGNEKTYVLRMKSILLYFSEVTKDIHFLDGGVFCDGLEKVEIILKTDLCSVITVRRICYSNLSPLWQLGIIITLLVG